MHNEVFDSTQKIALEYILRSAKCPHIVSIVPFIVIKEASNAIRKICEVLWQITFLVPPSHDAVQLGL